MDPKQVADEIGDFIIRTVLKLNKTGGVVGLSGGVDSTCVASIAKRAFDRHNAKSPDKPLEIVGYILPSNTNHPQDAEDGLKVAERLGIRHEVRSIEAIVEAFKKRLKDVAGFKHVPSPMPMRNSKGAVVYYLFFASQKDVANNIVKDIFKKYHKRR